MFKISERRVCKVLSQPRSTQRYKTKKTKEEERLKEDIITLAASYGRYGYRRVAALLKENGWKINHKRVERIWRQEGLKVPDKQPKKKRLWLNDGSCIRLKPQWKNHVWSYDIVTDKTEDGRSFRVLNIIDEFSRECLSMTIQRRITSKDTIEALNSLFIKRGFPNYIRSDNGPEFRAQAVREWLKVLGVKTLFIEPGSPWENGYVESFNGKLRTEFLNGEIFTTLLEAQVLIEAWRVEYNTVRPHSSLGYRPPAPEAIMPKMPSIRRAVMAGN